MPEDIKPDESKDFKAGDNEYTQLEEEKARFVGAKSKWLVDRGHTDELDAHMEKAGEMYDELKADGREEVIDDTIKGAQEHDNIQ